MRPEGREPLADREGESTLLSQLGGEKGSDEVVPGTSVRWCGNAGWVWEPKPGRVGKAGCFASPGLWLCVIGVGVHSCPVSLPSAAQLPGLSSQGPYPQPSWYATGEKALASSCSEGGGGQNALPDDMMRAGWTHLQGKAVGKSGFHPVGQRLSTPLPAPALTPLQSALTLAARVILVRHQLLMRVLPQPHLSSHPLLFLLCPLPHSISPVEFFFPPNQKSSYLLSPVKFLSLKQKRHAPTSGPCPCFSL